MTISQTNLTQMRMEGIPIKYHSEAAEMFLRLSNELQISLYSELNILEIAVVSYFRYIANIVEYEELLASGHFGSDKAPYMSILGREGEKAARMYISVIEHMELKERKEVSVVLPPEDQTSVTFSTTE